MIIGSAALAAGGASAMPGPAANSGDAGQARLTVAVYNPAAPATLTRAEFPFGCWYANGWHGPGYYWCGYRPEAYYRPYYGYRSGGYYSYRPARYTYWRSRHRVRHAWRREHRRWRA
jgi:hypothetical protein